MYVSVSSMHIQVQSLQTTVTHRRRQNRKLAQFTCYKNLRLIRSAIVGMTVRQR